VFFYPRKLKVPNKPFLSLFLFFFSIENIFLAHFHNILSGILKFSDKFSDFFSGSIFFFSPRKKNVKVFFYLTGNIFIFYLGIIFSLVKFCCFFSGTFCSGSFQIFVSGSLKSSRTENFIFFEMFFFLSGYIFQNYVPIPVCYSFLLFIKKYPLIHTYPFVPFMKI